MNLATGLHERAAAGDQKLAVNLLRLAEIRNLPKIDRPDTFNDLYFYIQFMVSCFWAGSLLLPMTKAVCRSIQYWE
jgi:hypothetical protein